MAKEYFVKRLNPANDENKAWRYVESKEKLDLMIKGEDGRLFPGDEIYIAKKAFTVKATIKLEK